MLGFCKPPIGSWWIDRRFERHCLVTINSVNLAGAKGKSVAHSNTDPLPFTFTRAVDGSSWNPTRTLYSISYRYQYTRHLCLYTSRMITLGTNTTWLWCHFSFWCENQNRSNRVWKFLCVFPLAETLFHAAGVQKIQRYQTFEEKHISFRHQ